MKNPLLLLATLLVQPGAWAATYQFSTADYSVITPFAAPCAAPTCKNFDTTMKQTGSFTTAAQLPGGLVNADISGQILSYSFNDGITQYASGGANDQLVAAQVSTDVNGNITGSNISLLQWQTASHGINDRLNAMVAGVGSQSNQYCQTAGNPGLCATSASDASTSSVNIQLGGTWALAAPAAPAMVPTLSEWALLLLSGLLGTLGWRAAHRRGGRSA